MNHQTEYLLQEAQRAVSDPAVFSEDQTAALQAMIRLLGSAIDKETSVAVSSYAAAQSM